MSDEICAGSPDVSILSDMDDGISKKFLGLDYRNLVEWF